MKNRKYLVLSFLFGLGFTISSYIIELFSNEFTGILALHLTNPIFFLVDLAPFSMLALALFTSKNISRENNESLTKLTLELEKSNKVQKFIHELGKGNLDVTCDLAAEGDELGLTIEDLKNNLKKFRKEEAERNWINEGVAKFLELLRSDHNLENLGNKILSSLIKYIGANQGGIFAVESSKDNTYLKQIGCFAYDRVKMSQKEILKGEGLIGQAWLEKEIINLYEIPNKYVEITSGLGHTTPQHLVIIPLIVNENVEGVIEIAGFNKFSEVVLEFLKRISENIASSIANVRINEESKKIFQEQKLLTEALQSQEEELKQNMEEMLATQEQVEKSKKDAELVAYELELTNNNLIAATFREREIKAEMEGRLKIMNSAALVSKTDPYGTIIYVNDLFCRVSGFTREELIGQPHNIVRHPDMPKEVFENLWQTIKKNEIWVGNVKNKTKNGDYYWVDAHIGAILDNNGSIKEFIGVRHLITDYVNNEEMNHLVCKKYCIDVKEY